MKEDVTRALIKKAEQIQASTNLLLQKTNDWQTIKAYLSNRLSEDFLTDDQKLKKDRYQYIYNQLVSGKYTDLEICNQVMKLYGVKTAQAYEDISCTRELWNSVLNINKQFEIKLELQINRNMLRKCEELGDMKAFAAIEKNREKLLALLPDQEENPAEMFEGHTIEAVFDPRLLGAPDIDMKEVLKAINEKRDKKINIDMFDDIPYEELDNGNPETPLQ